jgi:hypothetical protein
LSSPNSDGLMHSQMALVHVGHPRRTRGMTVTLKLHSSKESKKRSEFEPRLAAGQHLNVPLPVAPMIYQTVAVTVCPSQSQRWRLT